MMRPRRPLVHLLLVALYLAAPALAAALPGSNDAGNSGIDNPGLNVTRNAMPPPDVIRPAERQAVGANPLWAVPLSALAATRSRPLFTPSRRPPAPIVSNVPVAAQHPVASPPLVAEHPNLVLVGTVVAENEGVAVFIDASTHDTVRLHTGEGHLGWILQSVDRRTVTLQKGDQSENLELPRFTAP
jgi:general secretion pathway protein N